MYLSETSSTKSKHMYTFQDCARISCKQQEFWFMQRNRSICGAVIKKLNKFRYRPLHCL